MNGREKLYFLIEKIGENELLSNLILALSEAECGENADYIARMFDINFNEEDSENE